MNIVKLSLLSFAGVLLIFSLLNINNHFTEKEIINNMISDNNITREQLLSNISEVKHLITANYMNPPKTKKQFDIWLQSRGILRQTALESLSGKVGVCGELSRVMIKISRELGIKARRLYVYKSSATNHVMFEFYSEFENKWIIANSYESTDYLENYLKGKNITSQELFNLADKNKLVYTQFANIPYKIEIYIGHQYNIPYIVSYFMDEVYIFKSIAFLCLSLLFFIVYRRMEIENK